MLANTRGYDKLIDENFLNIDSKLRPGVRHSSIFRSNPYSTWHHKRTKYANQINPILSLSATTANMPPNFSVSLLRWKLLRVLINEVHSSFL
ncbi:hypothetical protein CDAR_421221 [Caerostris darwini]|uniref:Uncharacterized protein n=1 Tax=Caerostris darwini TaxID=1538125 RepID=A0AAV4WAM4_9ARAC|nr:hypothetical protein CDAR_421221 [Caerostris darwini]